MTKRHEGKTAVISGAASGIGQAAAVRLAEEGALIVVADRAKAEETLQLVAGAGGKATAVECDVSNPASVAVLKERVERSGGRCDILVNNAGIYPMRLFDDMTFEEWRHILSVNLDSMFLMTKAFAAGMQQRRWGRVINIASDTVSLLVPALVHYITSKAGVIGFTRSLATEYGEHGVTGDALFGLMANTQSIKRSEEASDLVGAVSFLASDDAAFITGQTLYVNGGLTRTT